MTSYYRYRFPADVNMDDVECMLVTAIITAEKLHGAVQTRLDAAHAFDAEKRSVVIDARTDVGRDVNRLFLGDVLELCGPTAVRVERIHDRQTMGSAQESQGNSA